MPSNFPSLQATALSFHQIPPRINKPDMAFFHNNFIYQTKLNLMFQEISQSLEHLRTHSHNSHENHSNLKLNKKKKTKTIQKEQGKAKGSAHEDEGSSSRQQLSKEQKKEIQKEKNRMAAQMSRDRQKKYVEDLQAKVNSLELQLSTQLCKKCRARLDQSSTSQEEHVPEIYPLPQDQLSFPHNSSEILDQEPDVEPLPFIRVPFQKSDIGFGKIGSFFCMAMLMLAIVCFSGSIEESGSLELQERRIMQAVSSTCGPKKQTYNVINEMNVPSTLDYSASWPFVLSHHSPTEECKNQFWQTYLDDARKQISGPSRNLFNCNSPSLVRISKSHEGDEMDDHWTFLISDPSITHAHISQNGAFYVDEVDYLSGVYQMVAEKVVLKKVVGKNCLA